MPTRRVFHLVVMTSVLTYGAIGLAKLWAHRTLAERNNGVARPVAEAVEVL